MSSCPAAEAPSGSTPAITTVDPWKVEVTGECDKPRTFDLDDLLAFEQEERVYHFRCVERWAMNVPWTGFPMAKLLESGRAQELGPATCVSRAPLKRDQMPGVREAHWYPWPYEEALRMDEAMNELALFATGVYGKPLLKQHGAPIRVVVPWKYGYKNPKAIVKIELTKDRAQDVLADPAPRVRVHLERQPVHPAPALEPGRVVLARRSGALRDPDLQRLRALRGRAVPGRAAGAPERRCVPARRPDSSPLFSPLRRNRRGLSGKLHSRGNLTITAIWEGPDDSATEQAAQ